MALETDYHNVLHDGDERNFLLDTYVLFVVQFSDARFESVIGVALFERVPSFVPQKLEHLELRLR